MSRINFEFNKEKDLWNIWQTCNFKSSWADVKKSINPKVLAIAENKEFEICKPEIEKYYARIHNSEFIKIFTNSLNQAWQTIEQEFIKRIEKITKKPLCSNNFKAYITTMGRCPYNLDENWFMLSFFHPLTNALLTVGHEILHFQFHKYYWSDIEGKIGHEKTADLKESLTVLLNLELQDLWFVEDKGYPPHKKLREFIENQWKEEPNFDILLEKCVNYLREQ